MLRFVALFLVSVACAASVPAQEGTSGAAAGLPDPIPHEPEALPVAVSDDTLRVVGRFIAADEAPLQVTWEGRVTDSRHQAFAGALVTLIPNGRSLRALGLPSHERPRRGGMTVEAPSWFDDVPLERLPSTVTDADGRFEISAPILRELDVDAVVFPGLRSSVLVIRAPGCASRMDRLEDPDTSVVRLRDSMLEPEAAVRGVVVDESGQPLPDVRVRAHQVRSQPAFHSRDWYFPAVAIGEDCEARTDGKGQFTVSRLWPGDVALELQYPGLQRVESERVALLSGETADAGRLVMRTGGTLGGSVRDAAGRALAGAEVFAVTWPATHFGIGCVVTEFREGDDTLPMELRRRFADDTLHETSAADGSFLLEGLDTAEAWTLYALAAGHEPAAARGVKADGQDVRFVLAAEARWIVRVVDADTGQPLQNARLDARRVGALAARTGAEPGYVVFATPVVPRAADATSATSAGQWILPGVGTVGTQLVIWAPGHAPVELMLPGLLPGESAEREVALVPSLALAGQVTDASGAPLAGADVHLVDTDNLYTELATCSTDALGAFAFPTLSVGRWAVVAHAEGYGQQVLPATIRDGEESPELRFQLAPGARIEGEVRDAGGAPAWYAQVHLQARTAEGYEDVVATPCLSWYAGADEDGHYEYRDVPAGEYRIIAPGAEPVPVLAVAGGRHTVAFVPAQGRTLRGSVTCRGEGVVGALIEAEFHPTSGQFDRIFAVTDGQGVFALDFAVPGRVDLTVRTRASGAAATLDDDPESLVLVATGAASVTDAAPPPVRIELDAGRIEGVLRDPQSLAPWSSELVDLFLNEDHIGSATTDASGRFAFTYLPRGTYSLGAISEDAHQHVPVWSAPFTLAADEAVTGVIIDAVPGGQVSGSVRRADGTLAPDGTWVSVRLLDEERYGTYLEVSDGRFSLSGLRDGLYRVGVVQKMWDDSVPLLGAVEWTVSAGASASIDVILPDER